MTEIDQEYRVYVGSVPDFDNIPDCPPLFLGPEGGKSPKTYGAPIGPVEQFLAPPPMSRESALRRLGEMVTAITVGEYGGTEARRGIMAASLFAGGLLHTGWFTYEQAAGGIQEACAQRWGLADENDLKWIATGLSDGAIKPIRTVDDEFVPKAVAGHFESRVSSPDDINAEPEPEPLVANVIDAGSFGLLYGPGGSGKSFLALDLALCVASGRPWHGNVTTATRVLYVAAEGRRSAGKRTMAWRDVNGTREPAGSMMIYGQPVDLFGQVTPGEIEGLSDYVVEQGFGMVIIDTYNRCTPGLNENAAVDAGQVVTRIGSLVQRGVTVVVVHHTPKDGSGPRGSGALLWATDWALSVEKAGQAVTVVNARQKDRDDGDELFGLVLASHDASGSAALHGSAATQRLEKTAEIEMNILRHLSSQDGPRTKTQLRDGARGIGRTAERAAAVVRLVEAGYLQADGGVDTIVGSTVRANGADLLRLTDRGRGRLQDHVPRS